MGNSRRFLQIAKPPGPGFNTAFVHPWLPEKLRIYVQHQKIAQPAVYIQTAFPAGSGILLFPVYEAGDVSGAKAIVDVDHYNIGGTAVEHRKKG